MPGDQPTLSATLTAYLYCLLILLTLAAVFGCALWLFAPIQTEQYWYSFTNGVPRARVFVSPTYLYRGETPSPGIEPVPVNDWELATRLSYFLWSSAPDEGLCDRHRLPRLVLACQHPLRER